MSVVQGVLGMPNKWYADGFPIYTGLLAHLFGKPRHSRPVQIDLQAEAVFIYEQSLTTLAACL